MAPAVSDAPLVELRGLRKSYREGMRERVVLDGLDAAFARGQVTVLIGRSGTGKSTLLNLMSGIDRPDAGQVLVDGAPLERLTERDRTVFRRHRIGLVFQFFNLVPTLTVIENLLLPLELTGICGRAAENRASAWLEQVGLADRGESFPDQLSGGEQQRVALARALVHDPDLVLADEPTGNLDAETGRRVLGLLSRLVREGGKTLLMVTHSHEAIEHADRVYLLADGRLRPADPLPA